MIPHVSDTVCPDCAMTTVLEIGRVCHSGATTAMTQCNGLLPQGNPLRWIKRAEAGVRRRRLVAKVKKAKERARAFQYRERPRLSMIIQSFNHVGNVDQIMTNLRRTGAEEIIVCEDGSIDGSHAKWMKHLDRPNDFLIHSNDLHEIRASDRAISLSRGEFVCLIQDDDLLPPDNRWIRSALDLFDAYPSLGCLGGFMGFREYWGADNWFQAFSVINGKRVCHNPIPTKDPMTGSPFMFVENVNIGPYFVRKRAFESVGGWDLSFSEVGEPGLGYDHELGYRMWSQGFQVGLYYAPLFNSEVGQGGTFLWGLEARKRAQRTYPEKIRQKYESQFALIRQRVNEATTLLIPNSEAYLEQFPGTYS